MTTGSGGPGILKDDLFSSGTVLTLKEHSHTSTRSRRRTITSLVSLLCPTPPDLPRTFYFGVDSFFRRDDEVRWDLVLPRRKDLPLL